MARVWALHVGSCRHPEAMVLKGGSWRPCCFPARAFLIELASGELRLFDTGYAARFFDAVAHGWGRLYGWLTPAQLAPADSLLPQLQRRGVAPGAIGAVILSHWHADHMAGLSDFPHARVVCSGQGWAAVRDLRGLAAVRAGFLRALLPCAPCLAFSEDLPLRPLPPALAPFLAGHELAADEVYLVPLPGHVCGQLGAFVRTARGWLLLAADAAWCDEAVQQLRGPSEWSFLIQHQRRAYYATLQRLHALHQGRQVRVVLSHARTLAAPGEEL